MICRDVQSAVPKNQPAVIGYLGGLLLLAGCSAFLSGESHDARELLQSATPTRDSLAIEIVWIRFPEDDPEFADRIWSQVDEQRVDQQTRRNLSRNGFRAGVLGGSVPNEIATAIVAAGQDANPSVALGIVPARARRRVVQLAQAEHCEIQASAVIDELSWLKADDDGVRGDQLLGAQCVYRARVETQPGPQVLVELTPEIQSGPPITKIARNSEGAFQYVATRERQVFDDLRIALPLSAGEMLLITDVAHMRGSLGRWFHTADEADKRVRKLVLVRLAQVPASDIFADELADGGR